MTKAIPLTKGKTVLVDDDDFASVGKLRWYISSRGYAVRNVRVNDHQEKVALHRVLLGARPGEIVDHINHDRLNCQRHNLRLASPAGNSRNRAMQVNNTSGYRGVVWNRAAHRWQGQITISGKCTYLGVFESAKDAALVYDAAARQHFGEFANTNFDEPMEETT